YCKHIAQYQHPDHQHRIDRGTTCMRVVGRKLLVHPTQVENAVELSNQMIWRHHLVQIKRIKELGLAYSPPTHHEPLPSESLQTTESWLRDRLNESFATHSGVKRT